jgi:hypothetical protein
MTAGLPATGVGGLFYLLAALLLPVRLLWRRAHGRSERGNVMLAIRQFAMSLSMIAAVWLTGALLGLWSSRLPTVVTVAPIVLTFGMLAVILAVVEIGRLVIPPPAGFERGRLRHRAPDGQVATRLLDVTDRVGPARPRRSDWARPRDRAAAIRMQREREEPPITLA